MRKLGLLVAICCLLLLSLPQTGIAGPARLHSEEHQIHTRSFTPRPGFFASPVLTKATCSSDTGDTCTCGRGKLCVSGPDGCACIEL